MASEFPSAEELLDQATIMFKQEFNSIPDVAACAPEVIHLFGENADISEGLSMLIALGMVTVIVGKKNFSENISVISMLENDNSKINFSVTNLSPGQPTWANYIKGAIKNFPDVVPGFNALIISSPSSHFGFLSGATLLVAMYTFLEALMNSYATNLNNKAVACHQAEREYFDITSGISASIACIFGEHRKVVFVDSRTLEHRLLALDDYGITFMILKCDMLNKGIHELQALTTECNNACYKLSKKSLRDMTLEDLQGFHDAIKPSLFKLANYTVSEKNRVQDAIEALENKDFHLFGRLMEDSHRSLRNDFDLQCEEMDQLINITMDYEKKQRVSVLGTRMSTATGCIIVMINRTSVNSFMEHLWTHFRGKSPTFYILHPSYGARVLRTPFRTDFS